MNEENPLHDKVKAIRNRAGLSVRDMASALGMSASGYSHYEQRIKEPLLPFKIAHAIADVVEQRGISRESVMALAGVTGGGTFEPLASEGPLILETVGLGEDAPEHAALVPVYDVAASAGHGSMVEYEAEVYSLAFPPSYLRKLTSSPPENLAIISVKGESMEPTLLDDDIVLLDTSKTNLSFDGLFVLRFDDALHVKRIGRSPRKGHVMVISDNRNLYPPMEALREDLEAVGKVLWYGRRV